jgi:glycosyltransferase involved in cell wall biosynthesis
MLIAVGNEAKRRDWQFEVVFSEVAIGREWLPLLEDFPVTFSPLGEAAHDAIRRKVNGATVLHTHFSGFDLVAAKIARDFPNVAAYWHTHSRLPKGMKSQIRNRVRYAWLGRGVEENYCVTPEIMIEVRRRMGRHAIYLPNAIDTNRFPVATRQERVLARTKLGIDSTRPLFLHLGWDWHRKGGDLMLDALQILESARAISVGGDAGAVANHLSSDRVTVIPPTQNLRELLIAADVFLSSSRAEGMPYSLLEALSCGVPAVVTPINGHLLVADQAPGCHVAAASTPEALADAMARALRRPEQPATLHSWVAANADVGQWAGELCDRYERNFLATTNDQP